MVHSEEIESILSSDDDRKLESILCNSQRTTYDQDKVCTCNSAIIYILILYVCLFTSDPPTCCVNLPYHSPILPLSLPSFIRSTMNESPPLLHADISPPLPPGFSLPILPPLQFLSSFKPLFCTEPVSTTAPGVLNSS